MDVEIGKKKRSVWIGVIFWRPRKSRKKRHRDYPSCPEIKDDSGLDLSSGCGDRKKKKKCMDWGYILEA